MSKKKDNILKDYMSKNDIFADIVNYCLYDGKVVVKESDLKESDTTFVNDNDEIFEKTRDLLKEVTIKEDNKNTYILFGIENQTKIDYEMVTRVLLYDGLTYRKQFKNKTKDDIIKPVITIVIYYGTKKRNAPKSLHDLFKVDNDLLKYIPNYHLNLIEPYQMTDSDIEKLKSDFKAICDFIRNSNDVEGIDKLRKSNYTEIGKDTVGVINFITDSKLSFNESEGRLNMCKGLDEFEARAEARGVAKGETKGALEKERNNIKTMHKNGFDPETIAKALSLDINYVKEVLAK